MITLLKQFLQTINAPNFKKQEICKKFHNQVKTIDDEKDTDSDTDSENDDDNDTDNDTNNDNDSDDDKDDKDNDN